MAVLIAATLAVVLVAGVWDRQVLTETPKSLLYRLQYWESTTALIADYPWLGCGPGNFQHYYAAYKLPEASELVADPHHLFFEVAATLGIPALLVFVALIATVAWQWLRRNVIAHRDVEEAASAIASRPDSGGTAELCATPPAAELAIPRMPQSVYLGALAGVVLGWWTGFVFGMTADPILFLLCLPIAGAFVGALHPWTKRGRLPEVVPAVALLVLTVNLFAAGGISFLGIAASWWLLLAIAANAGSLPWRERALPRIAAGFLAAGAALLVVLCFLTLYSPVLRCRGKLDEGTALLGLQRPAEAIAAFSTAAAADPCAVEPWNHLAALYHLAALERKDENALAHFEAAVEQALRRNPRAHTLHRQIGDWRLALFARSGEPRHLLETIGAYQEWVRLYPNHSLGHAQLAYTYHLAGDELSASRSAAEALRLDALNPHHEKKLGQQRLYDPLADSPAQQENAEQTARRLRK